MRGFGYFLVYGAWAGGCVGAWAGGTQARRLARSPTRWPLSHPNAGPSHTQTLSLSRTRRLENSFDFLYVPLDFRNSAGLGYAFINLLDPKDTKVLYEKFHNKRWDERNSKKVCEITYARVQGRKHLIEHFSNAKFPPTAEKKFLPLVFRTRETVSGGRVVDGAPLSIFEYISETESTARQ